MTRVVLLSVILLAASIAASAQPEPSREPRISRVKGDDWAAFLGPTGDGKSRERGILTPWPETGLRVVWQWKLGTGYSMPTVSRGRLFQFERIGGDATLTCLES